MLGTRSKRIVADLKDRIFAGFVLAQMRPDPRQENGETERLVHVIIRAGFEAYDGVDFR